MNSLPDQAPYGNVGSAGEATIPYDGTDHAGFLDRHVFVQAALDRLGITAILASVWSRAAPRMAAVTLGEMATKALSDIQGNS